MRNVVKSVLVIGLAVLGGALQASAAEIKDMGIIAGYRLNDASTDSGRSIDGKGGFQVGGLAFLPLNDTFSIRTGFIYAQRNYDVKSGGSTSEAKFAYFDVPVTVMYKLGDMGGIFVGPGVGLKLSDDCNGNDCPGLKSTIIPITLGANFKIAPQFSAEIYYEASGKIADGIKDANAVGVNAIITFE